MTQLASVFFVILLLGASVHANVNVNVNANADTTSVYYEGELLIGAVLPLRTRSTDTQQACGVVQLKQGLHSLETLRFALDLINNASVTPVRLPFRLGAIIYDCCQNAQVAVENTINLMLPSMIRMFNVHANNGSAAAVQPRLQLQAAASVVGVLGAADSEVSVALASILSPLKMPQISFLSTSRDLSDKERFKYFVRTVPNDTHTANVILDILQKFNWTVISAVFDDTNYGIRGFADFERVALNAGICFSARERLQTNSPDWKVNYYETAIRNLIQQSQAKVVVLYLSTVTLSGFLRAARKFRSELRDVLWIGTDSWFVCDELFNEASRGVTERTIVLTPLVRRLPKTYTDHLSHVWSQENASKSNPWLAKYVEENCQCSYDAALEPEPEPTTPSQSCAQIEKQCMQQIWNPNDANPQLPHIVVAVLAFAYSLKRIAEVYNCERRSLAEPLCDALRPDKLDRQHLMKILREIEFPFDDGIFRFENGIDGPAEYSILFWDDGHWETGGDANSSAVDMTSLTQRFLNSALLRTVSRCEECGARVRWVVEGTCCWTCLNCTSNQVILRSNWTTSTMGRGGYESDMCKSCPEGSHANVNTNECVKYDEVTIAYSSWQSIVVLLFCVIGLFVTLLTVLCFWRYRQTPVVKACGRETSVCLLLAAVLSYTAPFVIMSPPNAVVCSVTRCAIGLCQTLSYAAMFTKALRIAVIFNANQAQMNAAKYCTAKFQAYAILALIGVELLVEFTWLIYAPSSVRYDYDASHRSVEVVCAQITKAYTIVLILPACILLIAAVFAFKIRKTPDGFNDSKNLGFVVYTNCALMVAVLPALVSPFAYKSRIFSLCILLHFSASSILYGLLLPKVYICVWRPEKNTKQAVMNRSRAFASVATISNVRSRNSGCASIPPADEATTASSCSVMLACIRLFTTPSKHDEKSSGVAENEAPSAREREDIRVHLLDNLPQRKSAMPHNQVCACQCECCVNWDKLAVTLSANHMDLDIDVRKEMSCQNNIHSDSDFSTSKPGTPQVLSMPGSVCDNSNETKN